MLDPQEVSARSFGEPSGRNLFVAGINDRRGNKCARCGPRQPFVSQYFTDRVSLFG